MSQHYYADGATHNDHHKEINIGSVTSSDLKDLMTGFFGDDAEEAEVISHEEVELCHFIYPGLDEREAQQVHRQIQDLVSHFPIRDICSFLNQLASDQKILQPQNPQNAFDELHRMGMPSPETKGFGYDNFCKCYRK